MGCGCRKKKNTSGKLLPKLSSKKTRVSKPKTRRNGK